MEIFKIISIAFLCLLCSLLIKGTKPEFSVLICLVGGCIILLIVLNLLGSVVSELNYFFNKSNIDSQLFAVLIKVVGIGYLTEFAASMCSDTGFSSLGAKIELGGKVLILICALPILKSILNIVLELLA